METLWSKYTGTKMTELMDFSEGYKSFMNEGKTERECVKAAIALAEKH